jgi:hypothetical protein
MLQPAFREQAEQLDFIRDANFIGLYLHALAHGLVTQNDSRIRGSHCAPTLVRLSELDESRDVQGQAVIGRTGGRDRWLTALEVHSGTGVDRTRAGRGQACVPVRATGSGRNIIADLLV